ncbi:hypothetical protein Mgra_00000270 [Meloidogyne graminicola]|uniref:Uncharacterized protein n=1 Tax=Meloidogyne graminicola TaxID=189291 RepID=A0A8T0A2X4_9BILA|nr:hypothetical protein Mgra_00000270 [Meloidogyne graminicola]
MLYRYLHQKLDTGPWTRKSSTLCSLLLLLATLFVLEDGKVELNKALIDLGYIYTGVKNRNVPGYNESLIPISCNITITEDFIKLNYDGTPCTIELLSDFKDKIEFKAGVRTGGKSDCLGIGDELERATNNTLPFIYSRSNSDINEFISNKGPPLLKDNTCSDTCRGNCTKWTSYEVSWSKGRKGKKVYVFTSLIGDIFLSREEFFVGDEVTFNLEIIKNDETLSKTPVCAPKNNPIGAPPALTITNTHLEGSYLLVFGLLPPSVDRPPKPKSFYV